MLVMVWSRGGVDLKKACAKLEPSPFGLAPVPREGTPEREEIVPRSATASLVMAFRSRCEVLISSALSGEVAH